jgi:hypothetical protein
MRCRSSISWQQSERTPALVAHPLAASLDEAHAAIELWEHYSRKTLDTAQRLAVELMMAEAEDGRWAADTTGRAESRQNGKGDEIEVVELWGLTQRSEAILHTAHEAATAASAHARLIGLVEGHRDLRSKIKKKQSWNGNYSLLLNNDGLIVWRTRTGAGGRGLDDISRIVVDEAQHAQPEELASSLPILSVNPNPQKNFMGSGGVAGKSAFWWRQRRRALNAQPGRFGWLEHSAESVSLSPDGRLVTSVGDVADPETWRRANPAYPSRISHDFLLDQLETLGPELFAREHLCVWDPESGSSDSALDFDRWQSLADPSAERGPTPVFGIATAPDRSWAAVAVAWRRPDAAVQVMLVDYKPTTAWVKSRLTELRSRWGGRVLTDTESQDLVDDAEKVPERRAEASLDDAIAAGTVRHGNEPALNTAVKGARWRQFGDGRVLDRKGSLEISPAVAAAVAVHGVGTRGPSVYESREMISLG